MFENDHKIIHFMTLNSKHHFKEQAEVHGEAASRMLIVFLSFGHTCRQIQPTHAKLHATFLPVLALPHLLYTEVNIHSFCYLDVLSLHP